MRRRTQGRQMKNPRWSLSGTAAAVCLYALASPALAQEEPKETPKDEPTQAPDQEAGSESQGQEAEPAKPKSDAESAIQDVQTLEAGEAGKPESLQETFFRLERNFVATSDDGFRRLGTVPIWPRGELKLGDIRFFPYLREGAEWESNYFLASDSGDAQSQWTHVNELGALADTALMGGRLRLSLSADSVWRIRYGSDAPDDTWDLDSSFGATYTWPSSVYIKGGVQYIRRHDPSDLPLIADDFGRTEVRTYFSAGCDRDIFFGSKFRFETGIQTNSEAAQDPAFSDMDRNEYIAYLKASYPFLKDTTRIFGLVRYKLDQRDSQAINDGKSLGFSLGLEGSIPLSTGAYRQLRGQIQVGFDSAVYDNNQFQNGSQTVVPDSNQDATTANVVVGLEYLMSSKGSIDLRYLHQAEFSFYGNYQVVDRVDLNFTRNLTRRLTGRLSTFYEHTDPSGSYPAETIPPTPGTTDAPNTSRWGLGAGVRWAWTDWADIDLSADMERRNDDVQRGYTNYRAIFGLTFYLNALKAKPHGAGEN
jgi:hypothetical protein